MTFKSKQMRIFFLIITLLSLSYLLSEVNRQSDLKFIPQSYEKNDSKKESTSCMNFSPSKIEKYQGPIDNGKWIKHSDPNEYYGPIVEGWGPTVSRDVKIHARPKEDTNLLKPYFRDEKWCQSTKMIIFQHSRPDGFHKRLDNRRTWMNYLKEFAEIQSFFVVGHPSGPKASQIQERINAEHLLYGDILQVDFIEHPNNNTLKTILALKYILTINWAEKPPEYVMKTDDDVYLNLPLYKKVLFGEKKIVLADNKSPLLGFLFIFSDVLTIPKGINNKF